MFKVLMLKRTDYTSCTIQMSIWTKDKQTTNITRCTIQISTQTNDKQTTNIKTKKNFTEIRYCWHNQFSFAYRHIMKSDFVSNCLTLKGWHTVSIHTIQSNIRRCGMDGIKQPFLVDIELSPYVPYSWFQ